MGSSERSDSLLGSRDPCRPPPGPRAAPWLRVSRDQLATPYSWCASNGDSNSNLTSLELDLERCLTTGATHRLVHHSAGDSLYPKSTH